MSLVGGSSIQDKASTDPANVTYVPEAVNPVESGQAAFERAKAAGTPQAWDAFLNLFSNGPLADRAREERRKLAAIPLATPAGPAVQPPQVTGTQRAVLDEEDVNDPRGKEFLGSAKWLTEWVKPTAGQGAEFAARVDIEIPERRLNVQLSLRRNIDQALPASHTIEITFTRPTDFAHGAINNVPGLLMKEAEKHAVSRSPVTPSK